MTRAATGYIFVVNLNTFEYFFCVLQRDLDLILSDYASLPFSGSCLGCIIIGAFRVK